MNIKKNKFRSELQNISQNVKTIFARQLARNSNECAQTIFKYIHFIKKKCFLKAHAKKKINKYMKPILLYI